MAHMTGAREGRVAETNLEERLKDGPTLRPDWGDFEEFSRLTEAILKGSAKKKGYEKADETQIADFVASSGLTHAEGEIVYKVVRWHQRHDFMDLIKIAGWAFLEWKRAVRGKRSAAQSGLIPGGWRGSREYVSETTASDREMDSHTNTPR